MTRSHPPSLDCAVSLLRLAFDECETAAAEIRSACAGVENPAYGVNYLLGTVGVVEDLLHHALSLVRAARTVLIPTRIASGGEAGPR